MNLPIIEQEDNCLWMIQDLTDSTIYEKSKAIVNFCDKEIKEFEKVIDREILRVFTKNGINVPSTDKSVLKLAYGVLKGKGKTIEIIDQLENYKDLDNCELVKTTKQGLSIILEDNTHLQCCVRIEERKLWKTKII